MQPWGQIQKSSTTIANPQENFLLQAPAFNSNPENHPEIRSYKIQDPTQT
jgi:hypothetical protein